MIQISFTLLVRCYDCSFRMGSDIGEERVVTLPSPNEIKVHRLMLIELLGLVGKIITLFPRIEASRPGCSSGREALCSLRTAIDNAKSFLQYCAESSKLYLALTSDSILQRCKKSRNALEQFLLQIQNLVPVILAAEISGIISELRSITFSFNPSEEAAGKIIRTFLQQSASNGDSNEVEKSAIETIQFVSMSFRITSQKDLATERNSIKMLLDKASDRELGKKQILVYLLNLLKNYGHLIITEQDNGSLSTEEQLLSTEVESLEEFKCPMSLGMMYDPVAIASGVTFERMWIQRWLDEGNGTCPKTKRKLDHFTLIPNVEMKDHISSWCMANGVTVPDPSVQTPAAYFSNTSLNSVASLSTSLNDLCTPVDVSSNIKSRRTQSCASNQEIEEDLLLSANLDELPWAFQFQVIVDLKTHLKHDFRSSENHVYQILAFMKRANDLSDLAALRNGAQLFLSFLRTCRCSSLNFHEDAYDLLASFLSSSDMIGEGLSIIEVLSRDECHIPKIVWSGTVTSIVGLIPKIPGTETSQFQDQAIRILHNLSLNRDVCSLIIPSEVIPKLVPFFEDATLVRYCTGILKNMSKREDSLVSIAETNGCIGFVAEALQCCDQEVQENASSILLTLCSHRFEYRHLVMDEGVIPGLVSISNYGNEKGKVMATELLRLLKETEGSACNANETKVEAKCNPIKDSLSNYNSHDIKEKKLSSSTIMGMRISIFSKLKKK